MRYENLGVEDAQLGVMMGKHVICATGIDRSRVEDMENRLRADVLREV